METTPSFLPAPAVLTYSCIRIVSTAHFGPSSSPVAACIEHLFHVTVTTWFQQLQSTNLLRTFLNVVPQSDNYGRLALEELSFLLPIFGWRCFYNLLQWSAIKQELHNWLNAVCSQEAPAVQADLRTDILLLRHPGTDRWASHRQRACSSPGGL